MLFVILLIVFGSLLFKVVNKLFSITYFSFGAMVRTWLGCCIAVLLVLSFIL